MTNFPVQQNEEQYIDRIININRVAKVVKGGRRFSFSSVVVVGDGQGHVGVGKGKANEVPEAIRKAGERAKRDMVEVPIVDDTIPHEIMGRFGSCKVMMRPASAGTGIIAGAAVRAIFEAAGVNNVLSKIIGTTNPHNVVKATLDGLTRLTTMEEHAKKLGKRVEDLT